MAKRKRVDFSFRISEVLSERARDAVYALSGPPVRLTLQRLIRSSVERAVLVAAKRIAKGKPFPVLKDPGPRRIDAVRLEPELHAALIESAEKCECHLADLIDWGLHKTLASLERKHGPFPNRGGGRLTAGRRVK